MAKWSWEFSRVGGVRSVILPEQYQNARAAVAHFYREMGWVDSEADYRLKRNGIVIATLRPVEGRIRRVEYADGTTGTVRVSR